MITTVLPVDPHAPDPVAIEKAAEVLRRGGLVAFPTETVYGLGANALAAEAVRRIFKAKGRPAHNPVIVHVGADASQVTATWPDSARRLAARLWPGPLTLVLPKSQAVPDEVTAGGLTVAVRQPAHPVALALIRAAGVPVAAPSANRSGYLSPTRAEHVLAGLDGRIDLLLDAGPALGGMESTVLDLTTSPPRLLRPGLVSVAEIEAIIGPISQAPVPEGPLPSPGLLARHYAPRTPLECVREDAARVEELLRQGLRVGWLGLADRTTYPHDCLVQVVMPADSMAYAAQLYDALYQLDQAGVDRIVVALPPATPDWLAIHDRLRRASASG